VARVYEQRVFLENLDSGNLQRSILGKDLDLSEK
jgi:hypothetical protein